MSDYQILWLDSYGVQKGIVDAWSSFELAYTEMDIGILSLELPGSMFSQSDFSLDDILVVNRRASGGPFQEERSFFVRKWSATDEIVKITAYDPLFLLGGRIIAYAANTSYSNKSGPADDIIKDIVRENLGSSAVDVSRRLTGISVQENVGLGASVSMAFSRDNVLKSCQKTANTSTQTGVYLSFDMVRLSAASFEFRTYIGQRGSDHGLSSPDPRVFSEKFGNLVDTKIEEDRSGEITFVYAGGQGENENRAIGTASSGDINLTQWNRREKFWDGRNTNNPSALANEAAAELRENRPRKTFSGSVQESESSRYGIDYGFGDKVVMEGFGYSANARISTVHIIVDSKGSETLKINLRSEW